MTKPDYHAKARRIRSTTMGASTVAAEEIIAEELDAAYEEGRHSLHLPDPSRPVRGTRPDLTGRQRECFDFVRHRIIQGAPPPTMREIGEHMGIRSTNGVSDHLKALERKGYITRSELKSRDIRLAGLTASQVFTDSEFLAGKMWARPLSSAGVAYKVQDGALVRMESGGDRWHSTDCVASELGGLWEFIQSGLPHASACK